MSSLRGLANQKLYHARILAQSWRAQRSAESIPVRVLAGAFEPAARGHLCQAYGWFLLEVANPTAIPAAPPEGVDALPQIATGMARSGELRELAQLEKNGWIADMLRVAPIEEGGGRASGSLAVAVDETIGPDQIDHWIELLEQTFERMADSLDEY